MRSWTRRLGTTALIAVALVSLLALPADAAHATESDRSRDATADGAFLFPAAGTTSYADAGSVTLSWDPGSGTATDWRIRQSVGDVDVNGECDAAVLTAGATFKASGTSLDVAGTIAHRCYQYAAWQADAQPTDPPAFVSGPLRVLAPWDGSFDLFRSGVFSTQRTFTWCVAASVQMMLNISLGQRDHSRADQKMYMGYAKRHDLYPPGSSARGTDPQGWTEAINHFEGSTGYHVVTSSSFRWAVQKAVKRLRLTGKPVGLIVAHSNHAWVMTGFSATADPAATTGYSVTAVYILGPLYPRQQQYGYDMPPDTRVSYERLRAFLTPYADTVLPSNPWQHLYVTVEP